MVGKLYMDHIAVLIPCYNESKTVEKVVKDFRRALPNAQIYVYVNNSSDRTDELVRKAGAIVRYEHQQGLISPDANRYSVSTDEKYFFYYWLFISLHKIIPIFIVRRLIPLPVKADPGIVINSG
jgi:cellulose synthase/poly-beta-1,6-N-acetylglucosamine synthase-like glycosyltransferase